MAAAQISPIGSGKPDISTVDAAIVSISKEVADLRSELKTQRSETKNIIIGVVVALVAIVATVAVQVILANKDSGNSSDARLNFEDKQASQQIQINDLQNNFSNLKLMNPYLK
jgi:hypothetical protein